MKDAFTSNHNFISIRILHTKCVQTRPLICFYPISVSVAISMFFFVSLEDAILCLQAPYFSE